MKRLAKTIVFLLGFVIIAQNAFADLPEPKKNENPNITAGRKGFRPHIRAASSPSGVPSSTERNGMRLRLRKMAAR